ncbi:MAG: hypothetical protein F6K00_23380 [Leptolyngbya sp. SIOISBB]|nr:hypothetical protein [Leptolyngbya sp. SIOISBB]
MRFLLTLLQWLVALLAGALLFLGLVGGQIIMAVLAALAFVVVFPPLQRQLEAKLTFLQPKVLKLLAGIILIIAAISFTPAVAQAKLCAAPVDATCPSHEAELNVDAASSAFVTAQFPDTDTGTEVTLELVYTPDSDTPAAPAEAAPDAPDAAAETSPDTADAEAANPEDVAQPVVHTAAATVSDRKVQFELPLETLPIGDYTATLVAGDETITETFALTGNPPRLNTVALCSALEQNACAASTTRYLEDSFETLYVTGAPQHIRAAVPVEVTVNYRPLPEDSETLNTTTVTVNPGDEAFQAAIPLPSLAVGTYEVQMASAAAPDFLAETSEFTVWPNPDVIDAAAGGSLISDAMQLSALKVCEKTLSPEEIEQIISEEGLQETDVNRGDRCGDSQDSFAVGTQTVNADVSIGNRFTEATQNLDLTFIWRYAASENDAFAEVAADTVTVTPDIGTYVYTLTAGEAGYDAGIYDVLVYLNTEASRPLRRVFVVQ